MSIGLSENLIQDLLKIGTVVVSLGVVASPIVYPKYSLFRRRAEHGLSTLNEIREEHDDIRLSYVERGEKGYKELEESAKLIFDVDEDLQRICLAIGQPRDLGEFTGFGMEYGVGDNGALYGEMENEVKVLLHWNGWNPSRAFNFEKLRQGIRFRSQERSHYITMLFAVLWATLSVVLVF